jgi:predicted nucleotidyltransferase
LLARLREIAAQIRMERPEVAEVRVFGSIARCDRVGTSDVDVLIVVHDGGMGDSMEQVRSFYPYFDLSIDVVSPPPTDRGPVRGAGMAREPEAVRQWITRKIGLPTVQGERAPEVPGE